MAMKRKKQIEESKKMIADALLKLLEGDSLKVITISQIAAEAGIGRNTFYNHFQRKEDIILYIFQRMLADAQHQLKRKQTPSLADFLLWRFSHFKNNPKLLVLQKEQDIRILLQQFRNAKIPLLRKESTTDDYTRAFIQGGIEAITTQWILKGMKESPKEMVGKIMALIAK